MDEGVVIIGPSGSSKSTSIRTLNQLEHHHNGPLIINGNELIHDIRNIHEIRRGVGVVFQSFNLFPHLTVLKNISLAPINVRHWPRETPTRSPGNGSPGLEFQNRFTNIRGSCRVANNSGLPWRAL